MSVTQCKFASAGVIVSTLRAIAPPLKVSRWSFRDLENLTRSTEACSGRSSWNTPHTLKTKERESWPGRV